MNIDCYLPYMLQCCYTKLTMLYLRGDIIVGICKRNYKRTY